MWLTSDDEHGEATMNLTDTESIHWHNGGTSGPSSVPDLLPMTQTDLPIYGIHCYTKTSHVFLPKDHFGRLLDSLLNIIERIYFGGSDSRFKAITAESAEEVKWINND